jgi:hypothetical protein
MSKRNWSVARLMFGIAILAASLASLLALRPDVVLYDAGVSLVVLSLASILTVGADRALFGRRRRAFWLGFTATGWLCAAVAVAHLQETRGFLLEHGPPLVRARVAYREAIVAAAQARLSGRAVATTPAPGVPGGGSVLVRLEAGEVEVVPPPVSEWYLFASGVAEWSLGLALGLLVASFGGFLGACVASAARRVVPLAQRLNLPYPALQWTRPAATASRKP